MVSVLLIDQTSFPQWLLTDDLRKMGSEIEETNVGCTDVDNMMID